MLRFAEVKEIVRLVVRFILSLATVLLLLVAGIVAIRWVTYHTPENVPAGRTLAYLLVQAIRPAFLPAVLIATLVSLFGLLRLPRLRHVGLLVVFVVTGSSITFGAAGLLRLEGMVPAPEAPPSRRLESGVLYRSDQLDLYAFDSTALSFSSVVYHVSGRDPAFGVAEEGVLYPHTEELGVRAPDAPGVDLRVSLSELENAYWQSFVPPPEVGGTLEDVAMAGMVFDGRYSPMSRDFLILAWMLALLTTSLWTIARATRWPLLNIILTLGMLRAIFAAFSFVEREIVREFAAAAVPAAYLEYLLPGLFAGVALILLLILILMPSFEQWNREVGSA
ncbi:MAG: hypothetical protein GVY14_10465 [Spirochaetes bacterium]|nr:hypothetical protein [Spirochaetota bacterium]